MSCVLQRNETDPRPRLLDRLARRSGVLALVALSPSFVLLSPQRVQGQAGPPDGRVIRDDQRSSAAPTAAPAEPAQGTPSAQGVATAPTHAQVPPIPTPQNIVPPQRLLGVGLKADHYDELGYPESAEGLLILELDPEAGPITVLKSSSPYYVEAQFVTTQRDAVWLARDAAVDDVLPTGASYNIPYGHGAVKRSLSAVTLVESMLQPHVSDNQKSYQVFALRDLYVGAVLSLVGLRGDVRLVERERYVAHAQIGVNLPALVGLEFNRTYAAFAVPVLLGGGFRYPALFSFAGTHWTTGAELTLGFGGIDDDPDTPNVVAFPGVFHELEWTFDRAVDVTDYRADPRPHNYGIQSFYVKLGAYADIFGGAAEGLLFDIHVGYRWNLVGPAIPPHPFKATETTYASERYVRRKQEEERRRLELEAIRRARTPAPPASSVPNTP